MTDTSEMKQLTAWQNALLRIGAMLMLAGAAVNILSHGISFAAFTLGTLMFVPMQACARYEGRDVVVKRLRRQQLLACCLFLLASACLGMQTFKCGIAQGGEWILPLTIASVLELYTSWRLPHSLQKAKKP